MPTPFYHIGIAEEILRRPALTGDIRLRLEEQHCPFLLGNTAPDVQVFSRQNREETHFFSLPITPADRPPWEVFLSTYPSLASPRHLPPAQAAFLTGYICHLLADWLWIKEIFAPIFGPTRSWGTFSQRLYLHNVLRTYLDQIVLKELPDGQGLCLEKVAPQNWLPFVDDHYLVEWRDFIARQLRPDSSAQTVEVFAQRQGIPPEEYYRLLGSEERMDQEVFQRIPRQKLVDFRGNLVYESIRLIEEYFHERGKSYESD